MKKILLIWLITILGSGFAFAANLYKRKISIPYPTVEVYLSDDCRNLVSLEDLEIFARQINRMPSGIPRISFYQTDETLGTSFNNRLAKSRELTLESIAENTQYIFVAYKVGEKYGLGNTIGTVWATNTGLILLNDVRITEAYGYDRELVTNLIIHEILHVYGLDHATGVTSQFVKNTSVMNLGKSGKIGMSFDDKAGLLENYGIENEMRNFEYATNGRIVTLLGKTKKKHTQGKRVVDGLVNFTHVPKGVYLVYVDGIKEKRVNIK